jgi:hypothetical protein
MVIPSTVHRCVTASHLNGTKGAKSQKRNRTKNFTCPQNNLVGVTKISFFFVQIDLWIWKQCLLCHMLNFSQEKEENDILFGAHIFFKCDFSDSTFLDGLNVHLSQIRIYC